MPLVAFQQDSLWYFADEKRRRALLRMDAATGAVEGYIALDGGLFDLHSIGGGDMEPFSVLVEKVWSGESADWCGIVNIATDMDAMDASSDGEDESMELTESLAVWLSAGQLITSPLGLDNLLLYRAADTDSDFAADALCSDQYLCFAADPCSVYIRAALRGRTSHHSTFSRSVLWTARMDIPRGQTWTTR